MKQQQLSPAKYIETKARTLPVYRCIVNSNWQQSRLANVIVMRKHVTGNITAGLYLVDLLYRGVKDAFYYFNEPEAGINERFEGLEFEEIEYNLAHNIVYAGHDFAAEHGIKPHKDFSFIRFILEEDDDNIPLIEIETGDENGDPVLISSMDFDSEENNIDNEVTLKEAIEDGSIDFDLLQEYDNDTLEIMLRKENIDPASSTVFPQS